MSFFHQTFNKFYELWHKAITIHDHGKDLNECFHTINQLQDEADTSIRIINGEITSLEKVSSDSAELASKLSCAKDELNKLIKDGSKERYEFMLRKKPEAEFNEYRRKIRNHISEITQELVRCHDLFKELDKDHELLKDKEHKFVEEIQ
ncbi:hypothetical protein HON01_11095 [Candidatus Woesearchaeota archaeon]|nr:hypothetical protein [Candidatus Woesearchaeota archaeon]